MKKLYCYVDETGQDTSGRFFLVAVIVVGANRDEIRSILKEIEYDSGKDQKWSKSKMLQKQIYIRLLIQHDMPIEFFYSTFHNTKEYLDCVTLTVLRALEVAQAGAPFRITVLVDGMNRKEQHHLGGQFRQARLPVDKVRGLRDESDEFIRLADAIAGFVRDYLEGQAYAADAFARAVGHGVLRELRA